jgi:hypothetical protein
LNRFDDDTKASFIDLYTKIDAGINPDAITQPVVEENLVSDSDH